MTKCPKVGQRVRFKGNSVVGPCVGVVTAIYKKLRYDETELDAAMDLDGDEYDRAIYRSRRGLLPESQWHIGMKPDYKPERWSYGDNDKFAPQVEEVSKE